MINRFFKTAGAAAVIAGYGTVFYKAIQSDLERAMEYDKHGEKAPIRYIGGAGFYTPRRVPEQEVDETVRKFNKSGSI